MPEIPNFRQYMNPIVSALRQLGGSASNQELYEHAVNAMGLTDEQLAVLRDPERGSQTEVAYRMAWARTYLKKAGYIENSDRGVWSLAAKGRDTDQVDESEVAAIAQGRRSQAPGTATSVLDDTDDVPTADIDDDEAWRGKLLQLLRQIPFAAFERLCQRILRESGFVEVQVTGRSGDQGVDGVGFLRLGGLLSFPVIFQCKRYQGTVGPREIRDFRGAMTGRSDKGLFMTTGTFTRDAQREATRDGAPPIDLVDGEQLVEILHRLGLGVATRTVELVEIDSSWFEAL